MSPELVASVVQAADRPAAVALAAAIRPVRWPRWVGAGLAAGVLAVGVAFGLSGDPKRDPPTKDMPAKSVAKVETPAETEPKGERIAFAGRVVDPDGKPVKGAKVYLLRWGEMWPGPDSDPLARIVDTSTKAITDGEGRYQFDASVRDYPNHWWSDRPHLVAAADGYGLGLLSVRSTGDADGTLTLVKDHPITGRVINLEGKPVAGARVRVVEVQVPLAGDLSAFVRDAENGTLANFERYFRGAIGHFYKPGAVLPATTTDDQGRFELRGVGHERLAELEIQGDGLATEQISVLTQPGSSRLAPKTKGQKTGSSWYRPPVEYVAGPEQVFEGTVTDRDTGRPVPGIRVWLPGRLDASVTDRDGKYRIRGALRSRYVVMFEPGPGVPYHGRGASSGELDSTRPTRLDVALAPAVWVTGKVIDQRTGKPIVGATVQYHAAQGNPRAVIERDPDARMPAPVGTGPDGTFRLRGFPGRGWIEVYVGKSYVWACERDVQGDTDDRKPINLLNVADGTIAGNLCNAVAGIDVDLTKPSNCVVTLDRGVSATIRLIDPDGKPLKDVIAYGIPNIDYQWTKPAAGDTIQVTALNPDRPRPFLFLHTERNLGARFQPKPNDPGPWTVKLVPTGTVSGRFVDADSRPIADAKVGLRAKYPWQSDAAPAWDGPEERVKTDADGRFKLTHVIGDADSVVELYAPDRRPESASRSFHARPGGAVDLGTIKPDPPRK